MLFNLLLNGTEGGGEAPKPTGGCTTMDYVMWGIILVLAVGAYIWMRFSSKKRYQQEQDKRNSLKAGDKITTIGGIYGEVVSVDVEKGKFVLETGDENVKSRMEFLMQAIYEINPIVVDGEDEEIAEEQVEEVKEEAKEETPEEK